MDENLNHDDPEASEAPNHNNASTWIPPQFDVRVAPRPAFSAPVVDPEETTLNFYRSAKWSPDGSCALTADELRTYRVLKLDGSNQDPSLDIINTMPQAGPILDGVWYPAASVLSPETFCFMASVRSCPVKLLDASSGRLRASYRIVDHRERFIAPHSMAFNPSMTKIYCGCEDFIEIFDIQRPGDGIRLPTTPSKKSRDGLKGIISALAFCSDYSGFYAAATYSTTPNSIALFDPDVGTGDGGSLLHFLGDVPSPGSGGVTQLQFHPTRPHILFAASRRSPLIQIWDLRNPMSVAAELVRTYEGKGTNQRMKFDVDLGGKWLAAGDESGWLSVFDVSDPLNVPTEPALRFRAHKDAIGSVSFHAIQSLALTVSGSRHFGAADRGGHSEGDSVDVSSVGEEEEEEDGFVAYDYTFKLWDFSAGAIVDIPSDV